MPVSSSPTLTGEFQFDVPLEDAATACTEAVKRLGWPTKVVDLGHIVSYADTASTRNAPKIEVELEDFGQSTDVRISGTDMDRDPRQRDALITELNRVRDAIKEEAAAIQELAQTPPADWSPHPVRNSPLAQQFPPVTQPPVNDGLETEPESLAAGPGFYPDPNDQTVNRYWDGQRWTDSRIPIDTSGPSNGMAVTSFVLGLVGAVIGLIIAVIAYPIPLALGLAAVPLGIIARVKAKRPNVGRKGMATWGVILGLLSVTWGIMGAVALDNAVDDLNHSLSSHCLNNPNAPDCQ